MKKLFKGSLIAAAVALSVGAQAASVSSEALKMSAEGVAAGNQAANQNLTFDIVVSKIHPAASTITLTFDSKVDLDNLACAGAVTNTPGTGQGVCGDITFSYGTGSFTFDNVVIDKSTATAQKISFDVNLGNPLTADSAFRVLLGGTKVDIKGASSLSYSSKTSADVAIETGTGVIAKEVSQFAFVVTEEFDGLIERDNRITFVNSTPNDVDILKFSVNNNETLAAALTGQDMTIKLKGDFEDVVAADMTITRVDAVAVNAATTDAINGAEDTITLTLNNADTGTTADPLKMLLTFDKTTGPAVKIPITGSIKADVRTTAVANVGTNVEAGEWKLDASIVNVPYLPVGYGLSPNVEIANEDGDTDVIIEGFDNMGNTYGPVKLPNKAKKDTVTKVSEDDIQTAFGLDAAKKYKLSVTFIFNADKEKITLAPYYRENESRVNVMSSQYKASTLL